MAQVRDGKIKAIGCAIFAIGGLIFTMEILSGASGLITSPQNSMVRFFKSCQSPEFNDVRHYVTKNILINESFNATMMNMDGSGPIIEAAPFIYEIPKYKLFKNNYTFGSIEVVAIFEDPDTQPIRFVLKRKMIFEWKVHSINYVFEQPKD